MLNEESLPHQESIAGAVASVRSGQRSRWAPLRRFAFRFSAGCVVAYAALIAVLLANETRLVYPIPKLDPSAGARLPEDIEEMWVKMSNGWQIHGWYLTRPGAEHIVLYCHGNAEHVAAVMEGAGRTVSAQLNANVLVFDYPGYGRSAGTPFEDQVIESGNVALAWLCQKAGCQAADVIIYGRSLGGGVAVALARQHGARALILDRTFDAITSPGAARYPWAPVRLLMRNRYPSAERIAECSMPVFISHFEGDEVIPIWSGRRLYDAAVQSRQREFMAMPGGHHLARLPPEYWDRLRAFLDN